MRVKDKHGETTYPIRELPADLIKYGHVKANSRHENLYS